MIIIRGIVLAIKGEGKGVGVGVGGESLKG